MRRADISEMRNQRYKIKIYRDKFNDLIHYGDDNNSVIDKISAFLLTISPILQHYQGFYINAGYSVLLIISPYILLKLLEKIYNKKINKKCFIAVIPVLLFQIYKVFDHTVNFNKLLYGIFVLIFFLAIAAGGINIRTVVKAAAFISCAAGILVLLQYILFYIFHFHLQLVPTSLLLPESSAWILGAQTGMVGITGKSSGFYRPSAFFLEPSHLFIYCFPILCLTLLSPDIKTWRIRMAVLITIGIILSTSGMGVGVAVAVWFLYYAFYNDKSKKNIADIRNLFSGKNICILIIFFFILIICYVQIDFFRSTIDRIFTSDSNETSSAIDGRNRLAGELIKTLSGKTLIFGLTDDVSDIEFNLPGFYSTLYKYGIVGVILSYLFYGYGLIKLRTSYFWINIIIIIISFFTAHTHGTFYMIYYTTILMNGYSMVNDILIQNEKGQDLRLLKKKIEKEYSG